MEIRYRKIATVLDIPRDKGRNYCKSVDLDGYAKRHMASKAYNDLLPMYATRSMSRAGISTDNGAMESSNDWIKAELFMDFHVTGDHTDGDLYEKVWKEAAGLRKSGKLLERFERISCPLVLIQGAVDPHPAEGVIQPLKQNNVDITSYVLDQCGHTPWREKSAREEFARILLSELEG